MLKKEVNYQTITNDLFKVVRKKSIIFLIGDFFSINNLDLRVLAKKHEVVAIIVRDKFEENPKVLGNVNLIDPQNILKVDIEILKELIKPSGYFNQKSSYIINFTNFFIALNGKIPTRNKLLNIKGVGEETADSILLYGYKQLEVKVDAYTKRMFVHLGLCKEKTKYIDIKNLIEKELQKDIVDKKELLKAYQELHALIVCHGKKYYSKKPYGVGCFL